ncbi:hypothetical protein ETU09_10445 [Apibacter muscae]|uniref:Lipoprotein n=1 Tax=Apibacter muscae TaxID=2509004 RepID=A0A563D8I0_9FLAO|nr:hypothetical protein [Apibacter muscae]TWP26114.1 hypothetical protein ETU09_10445 [Apibacter muscae]
MKKLNRLIPFSLCFLFLWSCSNNSTNFSDNKQSPKIEFLKESTDSDYFYIINHFKDNEECIKYIFDFVSDKKGWTIILTDKNGAKFEGRVFISFDTNKQRFSFFRKNNSLKNYSIRVNFLKNTPLSFSVEEKENQKQLKAAFNTLTVNTVQNFLDYAEKDQAKKQTETYTYLLLNKNNQQKMQLNYHEYGDWFEVEIF